MVEVSMVVLVWMVVNSSIDAPLTAHSEHGQGSF